MEAEPTETFPCDLSTTINNTRSISSEPDQPQIKHKALQDLQPDSRMYKVGRFVLNTEEFLILKSSENTLIISEALTNKYSTDSSLWDLLATVSLL